MMYRFVVFLVLVCGIFSVPLSVVAQDTPTATQLRTFLSNLPQPIFQISVRFSGSPQRDKVWNNENSIVAPMPADSELQDLANWAAAINGDPGSFVAIAGDNQEHPFGGTLGSGTLINDKPPAASDATGKSCQQAASAWYTELGVNGRGVRSGQPITHVIVFDQLGVVCAREEPTSRITQGDILYVGLFGPPDDISSLRRKIPTCSLEGTAPNILDSTLGMDLHAGNVPVAELRKLPPFECFDDLIEVQFIRQDNSIAFSETFRQFKRYRATYQIGALWTTLNAPEYTVTDFGDSPIIRSKVDDSRGPEYVGSLVIYGIPHYFSSLTGSNRYSGRDIVNENSFSDRLGLLLSIGLNDPKDTLGIGLSFELATGFNLTVTQLYRRIERLDGVTVGDPFGGTAEQIPTTKTWEDEIAIGLSIDGRYLSKFFDNGASQ